MPACAGMGLLLLKSVAKDGRFVIFAFRDERKN